MTRGFLPAALALALALSACGGGGPSRQKSARNYGTTPSPKVSQEAPSTYKVGRPYEIAGARYRPQERFVFQEIGQASWYGPGFHGRKTANGERFNQRAMTAAHPTLQMPSIVRVTNLGNGKSAVVRVNDRGPYHGDRVIDLSEAAAEELGFKHLGVAKVRVDVLEEASRQAAALAKERVSVKRLEAVRLAAARGETDRAPTPQAPAKGEVRLASIGDDVGGSARTSVSPAERAFIQAGAFSNLANARSLEAKISAFGPVDILPTYVNGQRLYRVRLGPYPDIQTAEQALEEVAIMGVSDAHLVVLQ